MKAVFQWLKPCCLKSCLDVRVVVHEAYPYPCPVFRVRCCWCACQEIIDGPGSSHSIGCWNYRIYPQYNPFPAKHPYSFTELRHAISERRHAWLHACSAPTRYRCVDDAIILLSPVDKMSRQMLRNKNNAVAVL